MRWTKLTNIVEFATGIGELDLTPYAASSMEKNDPPPIYSLYGISNHMGKLLFFMFSFKKKRERNGIESGIGYILHKQKSSACEECVCVSARHFLNWRVGVLCNLSF